MIEKSKLRIEIEALLKRNPNGLNTRDIAERVGADLVQVQRVITRLREQLSVRPTGKHNAPYVWINDGDKVTEALPNRISKMSGLFVPSRDSEISPKRPGSDQHELYGSRFGDWVHYRNGSKKHISET